MCALSAYNQFVTETYLSIGDESSWVMAVLGVAVLAGVGIAYATNRQKPKGFASMMALGCWYTLAGLTGIPSSIMFFVTCCLFIPTVFAKERPMPSFQRPLFVVVVLAMATFSFWIEVEQRITLTDHDIRSVGAGLGRSYRYNEGQAPRLGLVVQADAEHVSPELRPSYFWHLSTRGVVQEQIHSPRIDGSAYYWGPHGLIRGDDLGKHVAAWAGTTPDYKTD